MCVSVSHTIAEKGFVQHSSHSLSLSPSLSLFICRLATSISSLNLNLYHTHS